MILHRSRRRPICGALSKRHPRQTAAATHCTAAPWPTLPSLTQSSSSTSLWEVSHAIRFDSAPHLLNHVRFSARASTFQVDMLSSSVNYIAEAPAMFDLSGARHIVFVGMAADSVFRREAWKDQDGVIQGRCTKNRRKFPTILYWRDEEERQATGVQRLQVPSSGQYFPSCLVCSHTIVDYPVGILSPK